MRALLRRIRRAGEGAVQAVARWVLRTIMAARSREWRAADLGRPAVVFAPHQDDEVLGCGGTIVRKVRAGADVTVVFMTDGSAAHGDLIAGDELSRIRAAEARAACDLLEVPKNRVLFLGLPDGRLGDHLDEAAQRVAEILERFRPVEVFIPHYHDGSPDHLATTRAVLTALRQSAYPAVVYEYPVWLWCHWPWIGLPSSLGELPETLRRSAEGNWRLVRDCRHHVPIGDLLDLKRAALDRHESQLKRRVPDPGWFVLGDIADGAFLACFFQNREIFYRHSPTAGPKF